MKRIKDKPASLQEVMFNLPVDMFLNEALGPQKDHISMRILQKHGLWYPLYIGPWNQNVRSVLFMWSLEPLNSIRGFRRPNRPPPPSQYGCLVAL